MVCDRAEPSPFGERASNTSPLQPMLNHPSGCAVVSDEVVCIDNMTPVTLAK